MVLDPTHVSIPQWKNERAASPNPALSRTRYVDASRRLRAPASFALERVSELEGKFSINRHFHREAVIQAAVFVVIILLGLVIAVIGSRIFGRSQ